MVGEKSSNNKPDSKRVEALRRFPKEVMESLTKEEVRVFLYEDAWPDSLQEKLKNYLVDQD
ncbi:MAG: hypothetical protein JRI52_01015 [Deltaproteobacteria bacterium]|nr:hypothetical protein [Deltaproteobacteria bacterium]